jgi:hypothetical protein
MGKMDMMLGDFQIMFDSWLKKTHVLMTYVDKSRRCYIRESSLFLFSKEAESLFSQYHCNVLKKKCTESEEEMHMTVIKFYGKQSWKKITSLREELSDKLKDWRYMDNELKEKMDLLLTVEGMSQLVRNIYSHRREYHCRIHDFELETTAFIETAMSSYALVQRTYHSLLSKQIQSCVMDNETFQSCVEDELVKDITRNFVVGSDMKSVLEIVRCDGTKMTVKLPYKEMLLIGMLKKSVVSECTMKSKAVVLERMSMEQLLEIRDMESQTSGKRHHDGGNGTGVAAGTGAGGTIGTQGALGATGGTGVGDGTADGGQQADGAMGTQGTGGTGDGDGTAVGQQQQQHNPPPILSTWDDLDMDLLRVNFTFPFNEEDAQLMMVANFLLQRFGDGSTCDFHLSDTKADQKKFSITKHCPFTPVFAQKQETLIISSPVEMTILRTDVDNFRRAMDQQGYSLVQHERNEGLCYDKSMCNNKPPFSAIVTALVNANVKYIGIVVAGMRWKFNNHVCNTPERVFADIDLLRAEGVIVEVPMVDISVMSPEAKNVASYWRNGHRNSDNPITTGWHIHNYPLWKLKKDQSNVKVGTMSVKNKNHDDEVKHQSNLQEIPDGIGVSNVKLYNTVGHTTRNWLTNQVDPNRDLFWQFGFRQMQIVKKLVRAINDCSHEVIRKMTSNDVHGTRLRLEVCFRFPYVMTYNPESTLYEMNEGFEYTNAKKGMSDMSLDALVQSFRYIKNELIPELGITPKLHDGYPYEKIICRCKHLVAVLMRELKSRDVTLVRDQFDTEAKREWLSAALSECMATLGFSGSKLSQQYRKWEDQKSTLETAYDPDGYLWLLNYMSIHSNPPNGDGDNNFNPSDYMDEYGNVENLGQNLIDQFFAMDPVTAAGRRLQDTQDQNRNVTTALTIRRQGEAQTLNRRMSRVQPYLVQHGLLVGATTSTGVPPAVLAVSGTTRNDANMLDYNVTELTDLERASRDANNPILSEGDYAAFLPLLTEALKHFHDPAHSHQPYYFPIAATTWSHISGVGPNGQVVPMYYTLTNKLQQTFCRGLGMSVRTRFRTNFLIYCGLARKYSITGVVYPDSFTPDMNDTVRV